MEKDDQKTAAPENENEKTKCQINKTEEIMDNVPVNDKNAKNKCHIKYSKQESDKGIQNSLSVNEDCLLSVKSTADITGHDCHDGEQICTDGPAEKQQCTTTNAEDAKDNSMITKENQLVGFKSNEDILNCGVLIELESLTPGTLGKEASTSMEISTITEVNNFEESKNLQHMEATVDDGADLVKEGPSFSGEISIIAPKTDKCDNLKSTEITGDMKVQENLSPCTKVNEYADERIHKVKPSNSNCKGIQSGETESKEGVKSGALEPVCPSMQNIKELNKPKEVTGRLSMPKEASLFQLDDHAPSVNTLQFDSDNMLRPRSLTDTNIEPKNGQKQLVKQSLSTSKSLDSQLISLKKGCELLETRPRKSSLRSRGSDGCLVSKLMNCILHLGKDKLKMKTKVQLFRTLSHILVTHPLFQTYLVLQSLLAKINHLLIAVIKVHHLFIQLAPGL